MNAYIWIIEKEGQWWKWELRAPNGRTMLKSPAQYASRKLAQDNILTVKNVITNGNFATHIKG
jgi:uncharacterized protein YegP (UPF0339 family)